MGLSTLEAAAPIRQVEDHTIDHRLMTFEDDLRSLESAPARFISALLLDSRLGNWRLARAA
jgi:hypothetical protein